jgi:hypothetical protein
MSWNVDIFTNGRQSGLGRNIIFYMKYCSTSFHFSVFGSVEFSVKNKHNVEPDCELKPYPASPPYHEFGV